MQACASCTAVAGRAHNTASVPSTTIEMALWSATFRSIAKSRSRIAPQECTRLTPCPESTRANGPDIATRHRDTAAPGDMTEQQGRAVSALGEPDLGALADYGAKA